ncbi:MAG: hypothetical protein JKY52_19815 [Flavobacteriales bacterium]|nr:hypothetical protein [Flavobacteriales bacterium]
MNWQPTNFSAPSIATDAANDVDIMLANAGGELTNANGRLVSVSHNFVANTVASDVSGVGSSWAQLVDAINANTHVVAVHPWVADVGQGGGVFRNLSPQNAVNALADKLVDANDASLPGGEKEAVAIMVYSSTLDNFESQLAAFNAVFPVAEFQMVQRRAKQLFNLDAEKILLPQPAKNSRWVLSNTLQQSTTNNVLSVVGKRLAIAVGYDAENTDPVSELQTLIAKKQQHIQDSKTISDALLSSFSGDTGHAAFVSARPLSSIANLLRTTETGGHENNLCAAVLVVADAGELTFLKEVLGL